MIKFLIACSGDEKRWDNYLGVSKHLVEINGERLLDRTIRLIKERIKDKHTGRYTINVIGFSKLYKTNNSVLKVPHYSSQEEKDKHCEYPFLYVSKKWWTDNKLDVQSNNKPDSKPDINTIIILFGDVYFTEEAIDTIIETASKSDQYEFYGRSNASTITKKPYGEIFGVSIPKSSMETVWDAILEVKKLRDDDKIDTFSEWEIYRKLQSIDLYSYEIKDNFTIIDDFTEDFDCPEDYDMWIEQWEQWNKIFGKMKSIDQNVNTIKDNQINPINNIIKKKKKKKKINIVNEP